MLRGLFVTGTDTHVGKTVVSAALFHRYRHLAGLRYWKPIQTGVHQADDTREVQHLTGCGEAGVLTTGLRFAPAVSPHLAARVSGQTIDLDALAAAILSRALSERWIVEGAGGALVPVNDAQLMTDLMTRLALPVVVVSRTSLGTINHTLLTLEALRARALTVAGVVMVGAPNPDNHDAIEHYGNSRVLGNLPIFAPLTSRDLEHWASTVLDPDSRLLEWLQ